MASKRTIVLWALVVIVAFGAADAFAGRPDKDWKSWFGHFSGGYSVAQGDFGDLVDDGWILEGGATLWPQDWPAGIDFSLGFTEWDINKSTIQDLEDFLMDDVNNGDVQDWFVTTDVVWSPGKPGARASFYLAGGVGAYYLEGRLRGQGLIYYPPICDPWTWICSPGGVAPGQVVKYSGSTTEFGYNLGVGLNFNLSMGSQVYVEVKYHAVEADETLEYLPIQVGYRW